MWNLNGWEMIGLLLLALFIFGPERLPKVISDGVRMLRNLRDMARNATTDLSRELGTEVRLEDLHPKTFIRKHLLSEEEEADLRRPFDDAYQDVRQITADANDYGRPHPELPPAPRTDQRGTDSGYRGYEQRPAAYEQGPGGYEQGPGGYEQRPAGHEQRPGGYEQGPGGYEPERRSYDSDAT
jgi:sec-independent protein translocase protein TatB